MLRFDGEVADCPLGAACAFVLLLALLLWAPFWVLLWALLWAKALVTVNGNTSKTPHITVGRNFISTLFPAWRSRPRALAIRAFSLLRMWPSCASSGGPAYTCK
jgi:hypothetical protein